MFNVLMTYSVYHPDPAYSQGLFDESRLFIRDRDCSIDRHRNE